MLQLSMKLKIYFILVAVATAICNNFMIWTASNKENCLNCLLTGYRYNTTCFYIRSRECRLFEDTLALIKSDQKWYDNTPPYVWNYLDC